MGVSFKVSKTGTRFRPKPVPLPVTVDEIVDFHDGVVVETSRRGNSTLKSIKSSTRKLTAEVNKDVSGVSDNEVSFTLSLFPDGYSIGKPLENENGIQTSIDSSKFLHPYDRASEALFLAIQSGRLPGDILDDIPCKFKDGTLICEIRDYRNCPSETDRNLPPGDVNPIINKVCLRMSLENVVKDIPSISENAWTYGDLMEVESQILKALQPQLCLDPDPKFERLCETPLSSKLNLDLYSLRRKRARQNQDINFMLNNKFTGKKVCLDRTLMGESSLPIIQQPGPENMNNIHRNNGLVHRNNSFGSESSLQARIMPSGQDMLSYGSVQGPGNGPLHGPSSVHGKLINQSQDGQLTPSISSVSKRPGLLTPTGNDIGSQMDRFNGPGPGPNSQWKNTNTMLQNQTIGRNIQYNNNGMQKYPQQMFEWGLSQDSGSMPYQQGGMIRGHGGPGMKEEPVENEIKSEMLMGPGPGPGLVSGSEILQQRLPQQYGNRTFPQNPWNNNSLGNQFDNRKDKKLVQSPRVSGGLPHSPLSSKSGEFSSGSVGPHFGNQPVGPHKEKSAVSSGPTPIGQNASKRRSNSLPRNPLTSGVGSPVSVSNVSFPVNVSSPPVSSSDQSMLERFSKIEMVSSRFQLHKKKNKVDEIPNRKPNMFPTQQLAHHLSNDSIHSNNENSKDETCIMPLSKSVLGGSINVCKTRILNCTQTERILQGNNYVSVVKARVRLFMSEKLSDGTVAYHIGEMEDPELWAAEDYLPTLPNTHVADMLALQYSTLMRNEGYNIEDHVQPKPMRTNYPANIQTNVQGMMSSNSASEFSEGGGSVQLSNEIAKQTNNNNNMLGNPNVSLQNQRMNTQGLQMPQGMSMGRAPQQQVMDNNNNNISTQQNQQMMMQQRSQQMMSSYQQDIKPTPHQLQMLRNQQMQQQGVSPQQNQMQRKVMMGGLGNIGNVGGMVGLGALGNVMNIGGVRGISPGSGPGLPGLPGMPGGSSMNMSQVSSISNAITQQLRNGALTPAQAALMNQKFRLQTKPNMLATASGGVGGGARQMVGGVGGVGGVVGPGGGLSMLGGNINRGSNIMNNMNQMQQRNVMGSMGPMGPPKMMSGGMNMYMTQQQQQQQQMQLQQQIQMQQETASSPLQNVLSPQQMGSPSMSQQQSPQQMSQRGGPMSPQMSHQMSGGGGGGGGGGDCGPASPQLSSQTMGSVGSIGNSPMDLQQGGNKNNNNNNSGGNV